VMPGRGDEMSLEEVKVSAQSPLIGKTISTIERANTRLRVVGLKRGGEPISIVPEEHTVLADGDLILLSLARVRASNALRNLLTHKCRSADWSGCNRL